MAGIPVPRPLVSAQLGIAAGAAVCWAPAAAGYTLGGPVWALTAGAPIAAIDVRCTL